MKFSIFTGTIFHQRVIGKNHQFKYQFFSGYYKDIYDFKLSQMSSARFSNIFSLDLRDAGSKQSIKFIDEFLHLRKYNRKRLRLDLLKKPNFAFFRAFNPVCFWYLFHEDNLIALIADVTNTFGEKQIYLIDNEGEIIDSSNTYKVSKKMYVSPFAKKSGTYEFKISHNPNRTIIKEYNDDDQLEINTVLKGSIKNVKGPKKGYFYSQIILSTLLVIARIHLHAFFIWMKGNQAFSHEGNGYVESDHKKLDN